MDLASTNSPIVDFHVRHNFALIDSRDSNLVLEIDSIVIERCGFCPNMSRLDLTAPNDDVHVLLPFEGVGRCRKLIGAWTA